MEQQPIIIQQQKNNKLKVILFILLGLAILGFITWYVIRQENKVSALETKYKDRGDSLQAVRNEANLLTFQNDSLARQIKDDSIRVVYKTNNIYVRNKTNETTKAIYTSPTDSAKISIWTRILTDSTYTKGSGSSVRVK